VIISKTPLRMSFFGGGSDFKAYYENSKFGYGSVVSTAIDMYVYITVNQRFDDKIRVVYNGNEFVDSVDEVKHDIIRHALKLLNIEKGIEIIYTADIPMTTAGIGLSSSSALAVGVLNALHAYKGETVSKEQLAREACYIEIDCIGQNIGIQDQYAVSYGGFRKYRFYSDDSVVAEPLTCDHKYLETLHDNLLLVFTGSGRDSRKILSEQSSNISKRMDNLDAMVETVDRCVESLCKGDIDSWGKELDEAWLKKKSLSSGISNEQIDDMYDRAKKAGALGGKVLGAGGGGFLLLYCKKDKQDAVKNELKEYRFVDFKFEAAGTRIIFID